MLTTISTGLSGLAARAAVIAEDGYNPDIQVNENVPGSGLMSDMAGGVFFYIYICLGVGVALAALMYGLGKIFKNQTMQTVGLGAIAAVLVSAIFVGGANGLVAWFSSRNLT
ncbi:hypothetical protein ACTXJG_04650 [Glutamicibacter arilaitensis]|uniref:hypothetical protein n=1 Tax=Glutamicibacter arilaitensis TaxID=256701 RepID=UPI003FD539F9